MDEQDINIRGIVDLVRRRMWTIAITFLVVLGVASVGVFLVPPLYAATALIYIDPARKNLLEPDLQAISAASDNARVDSEVEILRADAVLLDVIAALDLVSDAEFGAAPGLRAQVLAVLGQSTETASGADAIQSALDKLRAAVAVQRRAMTYLIAVEVRAKDPERAALLANTIAQTHIERQLAARIEAALAASEIVSARVQRARADLAVGEARLAAFMVDNMEPVSTPQGETVALQAEQMPVVTPAIGAVPPGVLEAYEELAQGVAMAREQYQLLLTRSRDLGMQAELQMADSRIVSPALAPARASYPNTGLVLVLAGFAGLGFGVLLAFMHENFIGGFTSESQLRAVTRRPVVADLPMAAASGGAPSPAQMMVDAPLSSFAEAVRRARAGVDRYMPHRSQTEGAGGARGRLVMVTSALTQEGKTTAALSLARAYAASGTRTLLIDCDLRHPSIHTHLGIASDLGLLEYLSGRQETRALASIIVQDQPTGLSVLVGSRRTDIPTDQLVTGEALVRLFDAAVNNFDMVIIDTPPVLPVVDTLYLARHADLIALVVHWASTPQTDVRNALDRLAEVRRGDTEIVCILNADSVPGPHYVAAQ